MKFAYSSIISAEDGTGDFVLLHRPEVPVTVSGPNGSASYIALVDTGSDNTIFPKSVADYLGISLKESTGPAASVFGGQRVELLTGEVVLTLEADGESVNWKALVCFFDFATADQETVILGHAGFLDYFTAVFDGQEGTLTLFPNTDLPNP
jgi:predicted aspartyl protease